MEKTILRFEELPEKYAIQELELGAAEEDIRFPGSLWADMVIVKQKNEESKAEETEAGKTEVGKAETEASVEAEESSGADSTTEQQAGDADLSVSAEEEKALSEDEEEASSDESSNDGTVNEPETTGSDTTGTAEPEEEEEPQIKQPEVKQPESDAGEADSPDTGLESEKPAKEENDAGKPSGNLQEDSENTEEPKAPVATGSEAEKTEKDNESDDRIEKTVRRKIRDIEWELNFTKSSDSEIQAEVPGTYVYEPVIPSGYEIDLEVELPQILVKVGGVDAEEKPCTKTEGCTLPDGHEGGCVTEPPTDAPSACTCETACAEGAVDESCPVCAAADADLADCTGMLVPQAAQQAAGTPYIVSNLDELNNACAEANPGDTILFRDWTSREPAYSGFSSGVHVIFESYSERGIIWVQNGNLASVRVEQQDWLITLEGSSHVEDVILEAGRFELYSGTVENVKMTGGRFIQDGGTAVTGAFVYEGGSFNSIYLGENGTFQNLSGAPVDADINGAQVTVASGSTVDKNGTVVAGNLIIGNGYSFDPADGKLTITTNDGTFLWWNDGKIEKDALLTVEVQSGVTNLVGAAFQDCVNLTTVTLPSSLTVIEGLVFKGCTSLTHIDLPDKLEHIMLGAFWESGLTEITIPASVTKLFNLVFSACPDLKTVIFKGTTAPELPDNDSDSIFAGMASPPTVYVPDGATGYDKLGVPVYPDGITPAIKTHPQSRTVTVGEAVSFTVATEKAVPFFQWQVSKNGGSTWEDVTDARSATYDIEKAGGVMNGWQYRCKASSKDGEAVSNAAELTVTAASPTLSLVAAPSGPLTLPDEVTLTATLSDAYLNAGKEIVFTVKGNGIETTYKANTDSSGAAAYTITNPAQGTYTFGAFFAGDTDNNPAAAAEISGYTVERGTQATLGITGVPGTIHSGDSFTLSATGGSGSGAISWSVDSGPATIDHQSGKVTATGTGSVTVKVIKAADNTYNQAEKTVTFTVTDKSTYTVTFNPAGGTRTGGGELTQTVSEGSAATAPTVTRSGYTFAGWDKDFSNVTADMTVTAQWGNNTPSGSGGGGSYTAPDPKNSYTVTGDRISQSISRYDLQWMINSGKSLTLSCGKASMVFEQAALKTILEAVPATAYNITFAASPADISAFPDAAALIGSRPVYDFTISYKDGSEKDVLVTVNFPVGSAAVTLNYTPAAGEVTGSLFMVYVDEKGTVTWLDKSSYNSGKVLADAPHFSVYGVAYKASAPVFTDITNHWAKADIEFVAARGLLAGMGNSQFSPDAAMTRGMFVTALGRLAGISPDSYKTRSFTDITANAYYASYAEWAVQNGIVQGTGDGVFSPDEPVTREQMAVMMAGYAGQMGYSIPAPLAEAAFTDNASISAWAAKEVKAMQRAGIIKGKDAGRFAPQEGATRAEVSAVLHRFVEIVIDPATTSGWTKNDSGHWLYYKGGTALTGWQTIGKLRYYFNGDGVMHEGWKQDTSTNAWYYWTTAGAATGWREIDGKWYYFDENGAMAVNTTIDGYEVGLDGARK